MPALDFYTGDPDSLFDQLGKLVKLYNKCESDLTTGTTGLNDVVKSALDKFTGTGLNDEAINGLVPAWQSWHSQQVERRSQLASLVLSRLSTREVLNAIGAVSADVDEVIYKLVLRMHLDSGASATVKAKTGFTSPPTFATALSSAPGTIYADYTLDGATSPGSLAGVPMMPHEKYKGLETELASPGEFFNFRVTADAQQDGMSEGSELITWEGLSASELHSVSGEGSGLVATFSPINGSGIIENGDFEIGTGEDADGWGYSNAVHVDAVTAAASAYHGARYIRFSAATSSPPDVYITQAIPKSSLVANKRYLVSAAAKCGTSSPSGDFVMTLQGTGYGPTGLTVSASSLATSAYGIVKFFVTMPSVIPEDLTLKIMWDNPGTGGQILQIDDVAMGPLTYGAGFGVAAVRGTSPFVRGNQYTLTLPSYTPGVFQNFFRKVFGVQLPSHASPGIADSLAQ